MEYLDLLLDAVFCVSPEGRIVSVSAASERIFGYRPEEMIGRNIFDMVVPEDHERTRASVRHVHGQGSLTHFENRYIRKDGPIVDIMWTARWSEEDQLRIGVARDITALKAAQSRQAAAHAIFEAANSNDSLEELAACIHRVVRELLPGAHLILALHDAETDGLSYLGHVRSGGDAQAPPDRPGFENICRHVMESRTSLSINQHTRDEMLSEMLGALEPDVQSCLAVPLAGKRGIFGVLVVQRHGDSVFDSTTERELVEFIANPAASAIERMTLFNRLSALAQYDSLTGLANRRFLHERFSQVLASADPKSTRFAVLYIDLDGFKAVNDTHGHAVGDALLKRAGSRLSESVEAPDMVARLGGDEFAVLLESGVDPVTIADRIRGAAAEPYMVGDTQLLLSASIGISRYPQDGQSIDRLLGNADHQMYAEKGRRRAAGR